MSNPMEMMQKIGNMNERLAKFARPGEDTMDVFTRVLDHFEKNPPAEPVPPAPPSAPAPPTQPAPVAASPAEPPQAPPRYRFKDGPQMQTAMVSAFGPQWHLKVGVNPVDLMPLIGSTPDDPAIQAAMHKAFTRGKDGTGEITHERKRMPIAQPMIEPIGTEG